MNSGLVAHRSPNLTLRTEKLAKALGRPLPGQVEGVERFFDLQRSGYPERIHRLAEKRLATDSRLLHPKR